jgi:cellulose biosynthesis protein BcsQ
VGGSGKTVAAANLAKGLSFYGHKVFLLQLESLPSVSFSLVPSGTQPFEKLLYYVKAAPDTVSSRLAELKARDLKLDADCLEPLESREEMEQMTGQDTERLLQALSGGAYDYVVADLDSSLHCRNLAALAASDLVLWIVSDDLNGLHKTRRLFRELVDRDASGNGLAGRIAFVANKYTGSFANDLASYGIECSGHLPYVPVWKSVADAEQLLGEPVLQEELAGLVRKRLAKEVPSDGA